MAVKVIRADLAQDAEFRARFRREVGVARRVSGLFTAPVIDADVESPVPWLATAYVRGPSLADAVSEHGPLPAASVLVLARGLADLLVRCLLGWGGVRSARALAAAGRAGTDARARQRDPAAGFQRTAEPDGLLEPGHVVIDIRCSSGAGVGRLRSRVTGRLLTVSGWQAPAPPGYLLIPHQP